MLAMFRHFFQAKLLTFLPTIFVTTLKTVEGMWRVKCVDGDESRKVSASQSWGGEEGQSRVANR